MDKKTKYLLILVTATFLLITLAKTFYLSDKYGGTDLRCRIVGTRLLTTNNSPYFYKWNPKDGEFYLDPNDEANKKINGNVVTPATMTMIYPLAQLSYPTIRLIWTILQVLAALAIIYLLFKRNLLLAVPIILGIICSDVWLFHVERGQMYIFYAFIFTLMYALYVSKFKYNEYLSGFVGGLFVFFRPFAIMAGLPFLLHGKKKWIIGAIAGGIVGFLAFALPHMDTWRDYFSAMNEYMRENMGQKITIDNAVEPVKPTVIEGTTNITEYRLFYLFCLENIHHFLKRIIGLEITKNESLALFGTVTALLSFFFYRLRKRITTPDILFLFAFLLFFLSEVLVPVPRSSYNIVYWIFPLSLVWLRSKRDYPLVILLFTALLLLHNFPFSFNRLGEIAELMFLAITIYVIFLQKTNPTYGISRTGHDS